MPDDSVAIFSNSKEVIFKDTIVLWKNSKFKILLLLFKVFFEKIELWK